MEANTALIRANSAIHLHPEAAVNLHLALIVHPGYTEHYHALGFNHTLKHFLLTHIRIRHHYGRNTLHYFANRLMKLILTGVLLNQVRHKGVHIRFSLLIHSSKV